MALQPQDALNGLPSSLRSELIDEFSKVADNYLSGRWEAAALAGGKLCEVVYTILKGMQDGKFPAKAAKPRDFPGSCRKLEQDTSVAHSARILIPRILPGIYDIRNNRSVGHVGGDVDANQMDATYVFASARWIVAELVRHFHAITIDDAQRVVNALTEKVVPIIWHLPTGGKRVLDHTLTMKQRMLILLYDAHPEPLLEGDLFRYTEHSNGSVFRRDVLRPAHKAALLNYNAETRLVHLSPTGIDLVEQTISLSI